MCESVVKCKLMLFLTLDSNDTTAAANNAPAEIVPAL